mmetsp:Transcript_34875/g.56009  ORF Transcript_34875/g.56009 Transcript_34875/m.56009 type:complete len:209 (-) Transcript_34875:502-1128(-)
MPKRMRPCTFGSRRPSLSSLSSSSIRCSTPCMSVVTWACKSEYLRISAENRPCFKNASLCVRELAPPCTESMVAIASAVASTPLSFLRPVSSLSGIVTFFEAPASSLSLAGACDLFFKTCHLPLPDFINFERWTSAAFIAFDLYISSSALSFHCSNSASVIVSTLSAASSKNVPLMNIPVRTLLGLDVFSPSSSESVKFSLGAVSRGQ